MTVEVKDITNLGELEVTSYFYLIMSVATFYEVNI